MASLVAERGDNLITGQFPKNRKKFDYVTDVT